MKTALFLGSNIPQELPNEVAQGKRPRVEYLLLNEHYGVTLKPFVSNDGPLPNHWEPALQARRQGWDAVLTTGEDVGLPFAFTFFTTRTTTPLSIIFHGSYLNSSKFRWVAAMFARQRQIRFLCLSESLRRCLVEKYGFNTENVVNCSYGVDTNFFRPQGAINAERPLIVSAGTATRDYKLLIEAFDGLNADLNIAADSAWYRAATNLKGVEIPKNACVESAGNYMGLRELYARAAFVVVPLRDCYHACGYAVIVEAMAMGKAVIATRTQTPSDYIIEGKTGFLVPPGDRQALRERMELLLAKPDLAACMGAAARQHIEENFTIEAYAARIARHSGIS